MVADMIAEWLAFLTRKESHRFFRHLTCPDLGQIKRDLSREDDKQIALYLHIPFCRELCPYCSFVRYAYHEDSALKYMESLGRELALYLSLIQHTGIRILSAYFGGGTPTLLMHPLIDLIQFLRDRLGVKEISVEANPHDLDLQKIKELAANGVNRLSIGVQSFSDEILTRLGRLAHTSDKAQKAISMAQGNFETVNVDMIWDLPHQSLIQIEKDIQTLFSLDVDQITFYPIVPSPNKKTFLERQFNHLHRGPFHHNRRHKKTYEFIRKALIGRYTPSTVWCFSKSGVRIIDEYAIDYDEYIGLGCGSVSLINGHYNVNTFPVAKYNQFVNQGELPIIRSKTLSDWEWSNYRLLTRLFGVQLTKQRMFQHISQEKERGLRWKLAILKRLGYLVESRNTFQLTARGMYQVNLLMRQVFAGMNSLREFCLEGGI